MTTKTKLLTFAVTAMVLAPAFLTAAEARVIGNPHPHIPVTANCAISDCGIKTPPKSSSPPSQFPPPGSIIVLPTAPQLPGSNLGGGGFGTRIPGGGTQDNCFEEFRCNGSVN